MKFASSTVQTRTNSPLGCIALAASAQGLAGLWFTEGQRHLPPELATWPSAPEHPLLQQASAQLAGYFAGQRRQFDLALDLSSGTAFQQAVWQALLGITPGGTVSYSGISERIGKPGAMRAVGAAIGRNPLSIVVPCHRVIGASGALTGYAGGLERKTALLRLEGALPEALA
jgi:methylated-DNA-[protein]-cysteine S-methyltransferase